MNEIIFSLLIISIALIGICTVSTSADVDSLSQTDDSNISVDSASADSLNINKDIRLADSNKDDKQADSLNINKDIRLAFNHPLTVNKDIRLA